MFLTVGSGGGRGASGAPELEQVVGGGDELPFGLAGAAASPLEAIDPAEELGVGEDRFDDLLATPVERLPLGGVEHRFDPVGFVALRWPECARLGALSVLGRDQNVDVSRSDVAYLRCVPVAAVCQDGADRFFDAGADELGRRVGDHGVELVAV